MTIIRLTNCSPVRTNLQIASCKSQSVNWKKILRSIIIIIVSPHKTPKSQENTTWKQAGFWGWRTKTKTANNEQKKRSGYFFFQMQTMWCNSFDSQNFETFGTYYHIMLLLFTPRKTNSIKNWAKFKHISQSAKD